MIFRKSIISIALISALAACGGSDDAKTVVEPPAPVPVKTIITGKALKGTFANAEITVYKFVDGLPVALTADELDTADIITGADGSYSITVLDYNGPIKVKLSVGENTTMICDAPNGCGNVAFGETIELSTVDPDFSLSAVSTVSADSGDTVTVNVSGLTHLASALIEADADGVSAETIQAQSSSIANTFNIMGSITELEPTGIDDTTAVVNEDNDNELRYGLINAGIMAALFSGEEDASAVLSEKLAEAVEDLVEHDGAFLVNQDNEAEGFELSLVEVLDGAGEAANAAAEAIAADPEFAGNTEVIESLEQHETNLENQSVYEEANEDEDGRSEPEVEVPTTGDAIAKAKAMVEDVRLFGHLFEVGTDSNTGITTEGDTHIALIDSAGLMIEAEAASFLLLADVTDALTEISMMVEAGTIEAGTFPIDTYLSIDDAVGSITFDDETADGGILFSINANADTESITLNATAAFAEDGLSINLDLDGSIESAGAKLSISEGSFAKVNLDSAASRAAFDEDSYEGEVTSGELSLEVILEQKASDTVTNPVAFTGMINTKLLPVTAHTLDEREDYVRDENGQVVYENDEPLRRTIYIKKTETQILPEMLSLSGGFSSLEGSLIKATLTVNIQDLESYEAPEFKYIGASVEDVATVTVSEDKNTVVIETNDIMSEGSTETRVFTSEDVAGHWSMTSTSVIDDSETPDRSFTHNRTTTTINGMTGYIFKVIELDSYVWVEHVVPTDTDSDGVADYYTYNGWSGSYFDEQGDLIDWNENIVELNNENSWGTAVYDDLDELFQAHALQGNDITDGAEEFAYMAQYRYRGYQRSVLASGVEAEILFSENEDNFAAIAEGNTVSLSANITSGAMIEDALSVTISADGNEISTIVNNMPISTITFTKESAGNFSYVRHWTDDQDENYRQTIAAKTVDTGLDTDEILINTEHSFENGAWFNSRQVKITPIDDDNDGSADRFMQFVLWGDHFTDEGVLVDYDGIALSYDNAYSDFEFTSYEDEDINWSNNLNLPFNPMTVNSALTIYKTHQAVYYLDGIGLLALKDNDEEYAALTMGSTTLLDLYNTHPDSDESLENEDVFLDLSAALSLEATLGDYQVKLMLSGQRTAFDDGKFDLEMSYKLPNDENIRKFIAHMKTDGDGSFSVNNSEGVLLIMNASNDPTSDVIGTIVVGSSATKVADIENRDGVIWFVFTDETTETL
jgi:hypothetical protein